MFIAVVLMCMNIKLFFTKKKNLKNFENLFYLQKNEQKRLFMNN